MFIDREPSQIHAKFAMDGREFLPCAVTNEANILKQFPLAVPRAYPGVAIPAPLKELCRQRADRAAHRLHKIPDRSQESERRRAMLR